MLMVVAATLTTIQQRLQKSQSHPRWGAAQENKCPTRERGALSLGPRRAAGKKGAEAADALTAE